MAYFLAGGGVAASQQFGLTQTDVFAVNQNGQLTVNWVAGAGEWQGPLEIGPTNYAPVGCSLTASQQFGLTQTDVFLVNNSGQLAVYWVFDAGVWGGPGGIGPTGIAPAGCPVAASQQIGGCSRHCMIALPSPMGARHVGLARPVLGLAAIASRSVRIRDRALLYP